MEDGYRFRVVAWWAAGRTGIAKSTSAPNAIHFTSPPAFGGVDGRWTPQDLLLCAVASCYTTTFRAVAEDSKFDYTDLQVEVEGAIAKTDKGYRFGEVRIRANLIILQKQEQARALDLLQRAEALCMVSHALAVEQRFEPRVQVRQAHSGEGHSLPISGNEYFG
ncbi:MAG: OsmC family protein [Terriglobales bacterium]|jgi:organic hydroperoxide reductase OsmC/OhrA